jgi:hypothetical protein
MFLPRSSIKNSSAHFLPSAYSAASTPSGQSYVG